jgi:hypothetical protein
MSHLRNTFQQQLQGHLKRVALRLQSFSPYTICPWHRAQLHTNVAFILRQQDIQIFTRGRIWEIPKIQTQGHIRQLMCIAVPAANDYHQLGTPA